MIFYSSEIEKSVNKGKIPKHIFEQFNNAFIALDTTKDLGLLDVKILKGNIGDQRVYFRLRKGKYRAIFFIESQCYYVISIAKRDEVYKKWQ